jgi:hypothetical protein
MKTTPKRLLTRSIRDVTVNTRVTKETQHRARNAAKQLGWLPADIYRAAFDWWLDCYEAAGNREPSEIERKAALASIAMARSRIAETIAQYTAKG